MKKTNIKKLLVAVAIATATNVSFAQTPYDSFAPSSQKKEMLKLPEVTFRAFSTDSTNEVNYIELDKEQFTLSYYDEKDSLLKTVLLEPTAMKWYSVDPLANHPNQVGRSPYSAFWNNPVYYTDPDGRCPECSDETYVPLADHSYDGVVGDISSNGWEIIRVDENQETGYRGVLYQGTYDGATQYIYATAGTQDGTDAAEDIWQLVGASYQYVEASYYAKITSMDYKGVSFTGHSLGGGLASAGALSVDNGKAVTFNAAGLSNATKNLLGIQNSKANITAYVVQGEAVDYYQSKVGIKAEGNITYLPASYVPQIPLTSVDDIYRTYQRVQNHMMNVVIQKFNEQQK